MRDKANRGFRGFLAVEADTASRIYSRSGPQALQEYLGSLDTAFTGSHYLVDRDGRDVLSGVESSSTSSTCWHVRPAASSLVTR